MGTHPQLGRVTAGKHVTSSSISSSPPSRMQLDAAREPPPSNASPGVEEAAQPQQPAPDHQGATQRAVSHSDARLTRQHSGDAVMRCGGQCAASSSSTPQQLPSIANSPVQPPHIGDAGTAVGAGRAAIQGSSPCRLQCPATRSGTQSDRPAHGGTANDGAVRLPGDENDRAIDSVSHPGLVSTRLPPPNSVELSGDGRKACAPVIDGELAHDGSSTLESDPDRCLCAALE